MLPARRAGILDMWNVLTTQETGSLKKSVYPELRMNGRRLNGNGRRYNH